jgi:peptide/nickel transport system substrate-binding protein
MRSRTRLVVLGLAVAVAALGLAACSTSSGTKQPAQQARPEFVERLRLPGSDYGYPTPFASNPRGPGTVNVNFVFDTLLWKDSTGSVIPWLAESYTRSPDALEWRFTLRPGILWQDGRPLTAEDVKFTFDYMTTGPGQNAPSSIFSSIPGAVTTVESPTVVTIKLTKPFSPFPVTIAGRVAIIPKHIWENVTDPIKFVGPEAVIGSGPYKLEAYDAAAGTYAFQANESYFLGVPYVRRLEFVPAPNQLLALGQGGVDLASPGSEEGYPADALAPYQNNPRYGTIIAPGEWNRALHFNLSKGFPYSDKKFRQAVAYTVDRQDLVKRILLGQGAPGSMGDLAPSNLYTATGLPTYERDLAKAKALLDEIGMRDTNGDGLRELPDGTPFTSELQTSSGFSPKTADAVKEYMREVGIDVSIKSLDATAADASAAAGTYEMALVGYGGMGGDPDSLRTRLASTVRSQSFSRIRGYANPAFDQLAGKQLEAVDDNERKAIIQEMQRIVAEDVPLISLYIPNRVQIFNKALFDAWYFTPGGVFGGYPGVLNKHVFVTGKQSGF